jgi:hypothetical protein
MSGVTRIQIKAIVLTIPVNPHCMSHCQWMSVVSQPKVT